jgi:hypothetical protein
MSDFAGGAGQRFLRRHIMNLLVDTHILLWVLAKPKLLPKKALTVINQAESVYFSPF